MVVIVGRTAGHGPFRAPHLREAVVLMARSQTRLVRCKPTPAAASGRNAASASAGTRRMPATSPAKVEASRWLHSRGADHDRERDSRPSAKTGRSLQAYAPWRVLFSSLTNSRENGQAPHAPVSTRAGVRSAAILFRPKRPFPRRLGELLDRSRQAKAHPVHQGGPGGEIRHQVLGQPVDAAHLDDGNAVPAPGQSRHRLRRRRHEIRRRHLEGACPREGSYLPSFLEHRTGHGTE